MEKEQRRERARAREQVDACVNLKLSANVREQGERECANVRIDDQAPRVGCLCQGVYWGLDQWRRRLAVITTCQKCLMCQHQQQRQLTRPVNARASAVSAKSFHLEEVNSSAFSPCHLSVKHSLRTTIHSLEVEVLHVGEAAGGKGSMGSGFFSIMALTIASTEPAPALHNGDCDRQMLH